MSLSAAQLLVLGVSLTPFRTLSAIKQDCLLYRAAGRAGGDARVRLLSPLMRPPVGFTGQHAHQLPSLAGGAVHQRRTCCTAACACKSLAAGTSSWLGQAYAADISGPACNAAPLPPPYPVGLAPLGRKACQAHPQALAGPGRLCCPDCALTDTASGATLWPAARPSCWLGLSRSPACRRQVLQAGSRGGSRRSNTDFQI